MKKLNVIIRDKNTLVLNEDGLKGDVIDLTSLETLDYTAINEKISLGLDDVYKGLLENAKKEFLQESKVRELEKASGFEKKVAELYSKIKELENSKLQDIETSKLKNSLLLKEAEEKTKGIIASLEQENKVLKETFELRVNEKNNNAEKKYENEITELKNSIAKMEFEYKSNLEVSLAKKEQEVVAIFSKKLLEKDEEIVKLNFQKSVKNVKQTGEDLESWCNNEVNSYMQNGLQNCVWKKDNEVIRNDDELKGSKSDFVLSVYATEKHLDSELLTSICMDMKDENPDSVNKKKNEDYYKQLDKNRQKKNCRYALLVSNLELDKPNVLPIFKVNEYVDMYVVRPAYLMTFINMVVSLSNRFKDIILNAEKEKMDLLDSISLANEFEDLKKRYLDKPLEMLSKEVESIMKSSEAIRKSIGSIDESCERIISKYINDIKDKLEKFNIKKLEKKLDKIV